MMSRHAKLITVAGIVTAVMFTVTAAVLVVIVAILVDR
jgi:hypothetical protein